MAEIIQVLLYSTLFLAVCGDHYAGYTARPLQEQQRLSDLLNLSNLLQSAARLAYPITSNINDAIGTLGEPNNYIMPSKSYPQNSYDRYPPHAPGRRGYINRNNGRRNSIRANLQNSRKLYGQDARRRHSYTSFYDYDYEYDDDSDVQYLKPRGSSTIGDRRYFYNSAVQSEPEPNSPDNNGKHLLPKTLKNVPNKYSDKSKFMPQPIPAADPANINDAIFKTIRTSAKVSPGSKNFMNSNNAMSISTTEIPNHLNLPNIGNQGYVIPVTSVKGQQPNHVTNGEGMRLPEGIPNLQKQPAGTNNDNAPANDFSTSNSSQPNVIYVVLKPGSVEPGMNMNNTINLLNNQGLKPNEDGASGTDVFYLVPANVGSGISNVNSPVSLTSVVGTSAANTPVSLISAESALKEN